MNCLCPYCENQRRCGGDPRWRFSCPDYAERQSAPADDREGALPGPEAAYPGPEKVSGDVFIIDQKEGEINGDQTRLLGRAPGEYPL